MVDDTELFDPAAGPPGRRPERQTVLDGVYARAEVLRRRRSSWIGVGTGAMALLVVVALVVVAPDRDPDVIAADLADSEASLTEPTLVSTSEAEPTSENTDTDGSVSADVPAGSGTTFIQRSTSVPRTPSVTPTSTVSPTTDGETQESTSTSIAENAPPTIEVVSVTPSSPKTGDKVTVQVRVVDPDTELALCGVTWDQTSGSPTTFPPPRCPQPICAGTDDDHVPAGETDRVDTFTHSYESDGTFEFFVSYQGGECTSFEDAAEVSALITVR